MSINELHIAILGVATTVSSIVSYYFGAKKNKADAYRVITETYQFALESLRSEMKARFADLEKDILYFRGKACKKESCKERVSYK